MMRRARCSMWACARVLRWRSGGSWWSFWSRIARMRWRGIRGRGGRRLTASGGCRVGRAGGVRGRICRGSRCGRSWWWRWRMSICRGAGFGIWRSFGGGGWIRGRGLYVCAAGGGAAAGVDGDLSGLGGDVFGVRLLLRASRQARVGSSSGSGVSCGGRWSSGTWRRLMRMRYQMEERPRMRSMRMSSIGEVGCGFGVCGLPAFEAGFERRLCRVSWRW